MTKDREQATPEEPEDWDKLQPRRSAAREALEPIDNSTGRGPASHGADPRAVEEVDSTEQKNYR